MDEQETRPKQSSMLEQLAKLDQTDSILQSINLDPYFRQLSGPQSYPPTIKGRIKRVTGMVIRARLPNAKIGEMCSILPPGRNPVNAQVVGFDDEDVFLTPLDSLEEVGPKTLVISKGHSLRVAVGDELLGRVVNSLGEPIDKRGPLRASKHYSVKHAAPEAMDRQRITSLLPTGIRAIDTLLSVGEGQRLGVFSGAGLGKSSLLGMIARSSRADVNVVALVGERGREVLDFLEENLGAEGLARSVVVVSTSDEPPLRRILAAYTATAIAEYFRDEGKKVMLLMDSVTRFARALREIALSVGEPPVRQGYPPSVFAALPELLERAGKTGKGSITAFYTILLASEQIEDPLGEEIRAILDGHIYLSSRLAFAQHFPAIDPSRSNSRVMRAIVSPEHLQLADRLRKLWSLYEENKDLISLGAYKKGGDPEIDEAVSKRPKISEFLKQDPTVSEPLESGLAKAKSI